MSSRFVRYGVPTALLAGCAALGFLLPGRQAPAPAPATAESRVVGLVATVVTADPQQTLDTTGVLRLPAGTTQPTVPLFVSTGQQVTGDYGAVLDAYQSGPAVVVGWRRGDVTDDHWQADGWRTYGTAFLFARGTEWDLGPQYPQAVGWAGVTSLSVRFSGHRWKGAWADGSTWQNTPLCGMQSSEDGYTEGSPAPWQLYGNLLGNKGCITLAVRTNDGTTRRFDAPADITAADLDVTIAVDLTTGVATGTVNGSAVTVGTGRAGGGWGPGLTLRPNSRWPFGIARCPPTCDNQGYRWAETLPDLTIKAVEVKTNVRPAMQSQFVGTDPRPQPSYAGGPSLPLAVSRDRARYLFAVANKGEGPAVAAQGFTLSDLTISGNVGAPAVAIGSLYGGRNLIARVAAKGGTRGIQCQGLICYPLTVQDCSFGFCRDRGVWLNRVAGLTLDRVDLSYGVRACGELVECTGVVRGGILYAPPGPPAQDCVWKQVGGQMGYEYLTSDYEYPVPAAMPFLDLTPYSNDGFATGARLTDCFGGTVPVAVNINPRWQDSDPVRRYAQPVRVRWDSLSDRTPAVAAVAPGVNPELTGLTATAK